MKRLLLIILSVCAMPLIASALSIDTTSPNFYAWGENVGWLNWGTTEGAVDVPDGDGELTGYVWGENIGWVSLNCLNTASCGTADFQVTKSGTDVIEGYGWGENIGWLSFNCSNTDSCIGGVTLPNVDYGVTYESSTGEFLGYAWGENVGWVSMNCRNESSCGTVDFKVMTGETPTPTPTPDGGTTGYYQSPSPTPTPTSTPTPTPIPTPILTELPPTPTATPTGTPPPVTPPTSLPPPGSPQPTPGPGERITDTFDRFGDWLFTGIGGALTESCGDSPGQAVACGTTGIALVTFVLSLIAILVQQEVAAGMFSLFQIIGLKRRSKVWGVIYDVHTKRPVPLAKVELLDEFGRVLETRFADRDGRYGFLTSPVTIRQQEIRVSIRPSKTGYKFPAPQLGISADYVVFDHLYFGGILTIRTDSVLNFNIPLEPVAARGRLRSMGYGLSLIGTLGDKVLGAAFYVGLIVVPLNYYFVPSQKNLIILILFFVANAYRLFVVYRPYGMTTDAQSGKPLPYALVTLNDLNGTRVGFAVSDEYGRYILSGRSNTSYDITAYTPANVQPQRTTTKRVPRLTRRGWATLKLIV